MNKLFILVLILASNFAENVISQVTLEWKNLYNDTITYGGSSEFYSWDEGQIITLDGEGNIYVTGICVARIQSQLYGRIVTIKYQSNGQMIWKRSYPSNYISSSVDMNVYSINLDNTGNIIVSGRRYDHFVLLKYSNSGNLEWVRDSIGIINDNTMYISAIDENGYIYTTYRYAASTSYDIYIRKYDTNGILLWTKSYDGSNHLEDSPNCIVADKNGSVIVGGYVTRSSNSRDFCTIKYDGAGNLQWAKIYDVGDDVIIGMSSDTQNNIYVTGFIMSSFPNHEICTIKYDSGSNEK
jgi:hypothetical protein